MPYDVGGSFGFTFHDGIVIGLAHVMLIISGRDFALILRSGYRSPLLVAWSLMLSGFVISFCTLFGIGTMIGSSGALKNRPPTALLYSFTYSVWVFGLTLRITWYNAERHHLE